MEAIALIVVEVELHVEDFRPLDLIIARDAHAAGEMPRNLHSGATSREIEARPNLLLERPREDQIGGCVEHTRFAERPENPVFRESISAAGGNRRVSRRSRRVLQMKAEAREKVRRPVLAEQVAPADLKGRARREFE